MQRAMSASISRSLLSPECARCWGPGTVQRILLGLLSNRARSHAPPLSNSASAAFTSQSGDGSPSAANILEELINHERSGIPAAAGTATDAGFDLGRMHRLLSAVGDPHLQLKAVHIAGSKGKGSTACLLASMLAAAGHRAGLYTSPHLLRLEERIAVGGRHIDPADLRFLLDRHAPAIRARAAAEGGALSHFEVMTALALRYFADCRVDVAVVETGMGGVRDATNVFPAANLQTAVITSLGLEHVEALGGSLSSIAAAKAGILRPGRPLVLAQQAHAEAAAVVAEAAEAGGCPLVRAEEAVAVRSHGLALDLACPAQPLRERLGLRLLPAPQLAAIACAHSAHRVSTQSSDIGGNSSSGDSSSRGSAGEGGRDAGVDGEELEVEVGLVGPHQHANVAAAVAAARVLAAQGWDLPAAAVAAGLRSARLPGRFQVLKLPAEPPTDGHYLVLDGAHTPESAAALAAAVRSAFPPPTPLVLLLAMAADKEHRPVAAALRALTPRVAVFTSVPIAGSYQRAAAPATLLAHWQAAAILAPRGQRPFRCRELVAGSLGGALETALAELRALRGPGSGPGVVVVAGSLHGVAAAHGVPLLRGLLAQGD